MTPDERALAVLDGLTSTGPAFEAARNCIRRIWRGEVSASLSGIEYHEPLASQIIDSVSATFWRESDFVLEEDLGGGDDTR